MARCGCAGASCNCVIVSTDTVTVTGSGSAGDPYELVASGGGGGGAGDSARALYLISPAGGGAGDPLPLTLLDEQPPGQPYIGVAGSGNLSLQPGIYTLTLSLPTDVGVTPKSFTMESDFSDPIPHIFPGGFAPVDDVTADFIGSVTATWYAPVATEARIRYAGAHSDITTGVLTVTRIRDV